MIDTSKYCLREAKYSDINFLSKVIIMAEKSNTDHCGLALLYNLSEEELTNYIRLILEEEIDGCEFSLSSFLVVEYEGQPIAASAGWLEGDNEDGLTSAILKSNLFAYFIPKDNILKSISSLDAVKEIQIEREMGTIQTEFGYVESEHRGNFLLQWLLESHIERIKKRHPEVKKVQTHVFESNKVIVLSHKIDGFKIALRRTSDNPIIKKFYPDNTILLLEKQL